jgi:anaerobic ribonucleoside-triphosphate reductase activating protein
MQDPEGGELRPVEDVARAVVSTGVEGVTFSGGEPFEQATALARLAGLLRDVGLSVIAYSGFTHEELLASEEESVRALLSACDVLVDGPFVEQMRSALPLRGSSNQRVIPLTSRYPAEELASVPAAEIALSAIGVMASGVDHADVLALIRQRLATEHGVDL